MKKILLLIICLLLVSCSNTMNESKKNIDNTKKTIEEVIDDNLTIDFIGYKGDYLFNLKHYMFHYDVQHVDIIDCGGEEAFLVVPKFKQKILVETVKSDKYAKEKYEVVKAETDFHNEPFILLCNPSELLTNTRITVNDKYSFSPSVSLKDSQFERPEHTEPIDYSYDKKLYNTSFDVITSIVNTTFDTVDLSNYSITMDDAFDLVLHTAMFNDPNFVGYNEQIFIQDKAEYVIPLDVLEKWATILFSDYTGELPSKKQISDPLYVDYKVFKKYYNYEIADIKVDGEYTYLLYKGKSLENEFLSTYIIVGLEATDVSYINYRIVFVEAPAG